MGDKQIQKPNDDENKIKQCKRGDEDVECGIAKRNGARWSAWSAGRPGLQQLHSPISGNCHVLWMESLFGGKRSGVEEAVRDDDPRGQGQGSLWLGWRAPPQPRPPFRSPPPIPSGNFQIIFLCARGGCPCRGDQG